MVPGSGTLTVAALSADASLDRAVKADLARGVTVRHCETGDALHDLVAAREIDAVVVGLLDRSGASVAPHVAIAHRQAPGLRIVIDAPAEAAAFQRVPELLRAGASEVAVRGYDRIGEVLRTVVAPDWQPGAGLALLDTVPPMVPESLKAFAIACALKGSPRLTVEVVSGWVRISPRTVRSRLRRASLSSPLALIRYCSAVHAMCLLYPQRLHPNRVVERMRFGTRRALNGLIENYSHDSTEVVPGRWAYAALLLRADEFLRRPPLRRVVNVGFDPEQLERYMNDDLTTEERIGFERWIAATGLTEVGEVLERMRRWLDDRDLERDLGQRREETWARLLRSVGSEREP